MILKGVTKSIIFSPASSLYSCPFHLNVMFAICDRSKEDEPWSEKIIMKKERRIDGNFVFI